MKDNIFDKQFKLAMQEDVVTPPPNAWSAIAKNIALKKQRHIMMRNYVRYAAIALLVMTIGASLWQFERSSLQNTIEYSTPVLAYSNSVVSGMSTPPILITRNKNHSNKIHREKLSSIVSQPLSVNKLDNNTPNTAFIDLKKQDITPLTDGNNIKILEQYHAMINIGVKKNTYLQQNDVKKPIPTPIKYSLSCVVTPGYNNSQYSSTIPNTRGTSYSESDMKGGFNLGGGVKLVMQTGKRFSFQTGIMYSKIVHSTIETNIYYPETNQATTLSTSIDNVVHSALGKIKNNSNAVVFQSDQLVPTSYTKSQNNNAIEQVFANIDIPLCVRYRITDNKFGIHLMGGFSGSILVSNNAYLNYENSREKMGKTEEIRPFNLSANFGVTFEYPLLKNLHFIAEPGFRYYLQSFSQDNQVLFRPYQFSFSTGIGVTF